MEYKTLGELCDVVSGGTPSRSKQEYWNGDIPWIKIGNIKSKYVSEADEFITEAGLSGSSAKMLKKGTILYTIFATLGEVGVLTIDACTNQAIAGITIKDESVIDRDYLFYYLKSKKNYVNEVGRGVAQNNINMSILRGFEVPLRDFQEQQEITKILDKTALVIEARKREIKKLDELVKARFVEMFGDPVSDTKNWGQKPLKEMLESIRYGTSSPPKFSDEGYAFIRATNIKNGRIVDNDMKFIPQHEADRLEKCKLLGGEIIIVRSGVNAGNTCVVTPEYSGQYAGYDMILVLNESLNPVFFNTLINTTYMEKVVKPMTRRAAQPHLNSAQTQSFPIICVPKEQQDQFAAFVKQVDKSKVVVQKALDEAQLLFDSLMQEYFGEGK
jgi:type I restriction enzyme S subunit